MWDNLEGGKEVKPMGRNGEKPHLKWESYEVGTK